MATLPFIEQEIQSKATSRQGLGLSGRVNIDGGLTGSLKELANAGLQAGNAIAVKRENDRILEDQAGIAEFGNQELNFVRDISDQAEGSDQVYALPDQFEAGFEDRFKQYFEGRGIDVGSDRYKRIQLQYNARGRVTANQSLSTKVAEKASKLQIISAGKISEEKAKAVTVNPELLQSFLDEPTPYNALQTGEGIGTEDITQLNTEYRDALSFSSGAELIQRATTKSDLDTLRSDFVDDNGVYRPNLSNDNLIRLLNAIGVRERGIAEKNKSSSNKYIAQVRTGAGKLSDVEHQRAIDAGLEEEVTIAEASHRIINRIGSSDANGRTEAVKAAEDIMANASPDSATTAAAAYGAVVRAVNTVNSNYKSNPFESALQYNPELAAKQTKIKKLLADNPQEAARLNQELSSEIIGEQLRQGLSPNDLRIIGEDNAIVNSFSAALASGQYEEVVNAVDTFKVLYKDNLDLAISNMGNDFPPSVLGMVMTDDPQATSLMARNINIDDKTLNENVQSVHPNLGGSVDSIVDAELAGLQASLNGINSSSVGELNRASREMDEVRRLTKLYMANEGLTAERASEKAEKALIQETIIPTANGGYVPIPKDAGVSSNDVQNTVNAVLLSPQLYGIDNIQMTPSEASIFSGKSATARMRDIIYDNGGVNVLPDKSGVEFYVKNSYGGLQKLTKDGKPFVVLFSEMSMMTPDRSVDITPVGGHLTDAQLFDIQKY